MSKDILKVRENAFEYEFCHKLDQRLLEQLAEKLRAEKRCKELSKATGIKQESVLRELDELKINSKCVLALLLYPLVHVAWADGAISERERAAVMDAAERIGHDRDGASMQLLKAWLTRQPSKELFEAWKDYLLALFETLTPVARRTIKFMLLTRARCVAEAAGGFMGVRRVCPEEKAALAELRAALSLTPPGFVMHAGS